MNHFTRLSFTSARPILISFHFVFLFFIAALLALDTSHCTVFQPITALCDTVTALVTPSRGAHSQVDVVLSLLLVSRFDEVLDERHRSLGRIVRNALTHLGDIISVGTMGSVGAAAPTIIWQWVQTMYSAPTIFTNKNKNEGR